MDRLNDIISHFDHAGTVAAIAPLGAGLINDSYKVSTAEADAPDYVLQRINHYVFTDVDMLQGNIEAVTRHIRCKLTERHEADIDRKVLMLADIPDRLGETIPDFHNMEFRLRQLREAVAADAASRVAEVRGYIDEVESRASEMCLAERLHREGVLPKRVCHCDTKVDNMMFDEQGRVLCVIDLDTVMPSYVFSDYGDFLRTAGNTGLEDDPDLDRVNFNMEIFRSFTRGYLESARSFLLPVEVENLPYAAALFPYMQCVRFLADYINGDKYYKIQYPGHNLVRTRAQLKLLQSVEQHQPEMRQFIAECLR